MNSIERRSRREHNHHARKETRRASCGRPRRLNDARPNTYEIGNALRTETQLTKTLPEQEADRLLYIFYRLLTVLSLEAPATADDAIDILAASRETGTSFYDASYLAEARKRRIPLATEDRRLAKIADKNGIQTVTANDLCP